MASSVRPRSNHYEALGLKPGAGDDEIRRAFIKKMSLFGAHPMDEAANILIAYETLRDPERRRAYDASLGLTAKPEPEPRPWSYSLTQARFTPFMAAAATSGAARASRPPEPHVTVEPEPAPRPAAQPRRPDADLEAVIEHVRAVGRTGKESLRSAEDRAPDWRRVGLALGGLVLGAGLVGTVAGLSVRDNVESAAAEPTVAASRPVVKQRESNAAPGPIANPIENEVKPLARTAAPRLKTKRASTRQRPSAWAEREAADLAGATQGPAPDSEPAQAVTADMPLSSRLVARTIERIGYSCGRVASTAPVEGAATGVFKITCSSGRSYQATPVRGRYHFRRLADG